MKENPFLTTLRMRKEGFPDEAIINAITPHFSSASSGTIKLITAGAIIMMETTEREMSRQYLALLEKSVALLNEAEASSAQLIKNHKALQQEHAALIEAYHESLKNTISYSRI